MNQKIPFYGMCFSHGTVKEKQKIKASDRRISDRNYVPIHSFGTLGISTVFSTTIVCFNILANVYGTEFLEIVSQSLLKYGNNYMERYKVTSRSTMVEKAVAYLFLINLSEIETYPQNRFYTFYQRNENPYDYTLSLNWRNETVFSNIPFPTLKLVEEGHQKYYTIADFFANPTTLTTEGFEENLRERYGDMFLNKNFIGSEKVEMQESADQNKYMQWYSYIYKFGICNIINVFSFLNMGWYGSIEKYQDDGHLMCMKFLDVKREYLFSKVIDFFKNYSEEDSNGNVFDFECKGIFSFHCKQPEFGIISEHTIFTTQEHNKEGLLSLNAIQKEEKKEIQAYKKMKNRATKLVTRMIRK